jgi:hypothetical protein
MRKLLLYGVGIALLVTGGIFFYGYRAAAYVPERYVALLEGDPALQAKASTEMFNRSQRLINKTKKLGKWSEVFTAEQINGYLAVDLKKQFGHIMSGDIKDPRVHIGDKTITFFCKYEGPPTSSVLSIELEPFLDDRRELALRIVDARAGALGLPIGRVQALLSEAALDADLSVRWVEEDGQPVAIIALPTTKHGRPIELTHLELTGDELRLAGEIKPRGR